MEESLELEKQKQPILYRILECLVRFFYPKQEFIGKQNLPDEAAIIVGNHTQMNGPIAAELYCPGKHYTWCAGQMMHLMDVPEYVTDYN